MFRMIAAFPLSSWAFAFRTWAAMVTALYAAFWLQLDSASSAAVTVSILALQTRGQAYQRALYRILATIIGVIASIAIAGLFAQTRELFMVVFAAWLGLCVYVGGLLEDSRAYGAVLSGYTVALVAVVQIDSPQNIVLAGFNRGAAIVVGVAALALISEVFGAPNLDASLMSKLTTIHRRIIAVALAILGGKSADPIRSANLLREITALRPDISALAVESGRGSARRAAARNAAVALVGVVSAVGALASLPPTTLRSLRTGLGEALDNGLAEENRVLPGRLQQHANSDNFDPYEAIFVRYALELLVENQRAKDAIGALQAGRRPTHEFDAPIYRSSRVAARNGLRAFLVALTTAALLSLGGWPFASLGIALTGVIIALSANVPNSGAFATAAVIAVPIAVMLAGVTEFFILDGVDQFPLLAIGIAPSVIATALLCTAPNPRLAVTAFLVLVVFPVMLSPTNPQRYDPEPYLFSSFIAIASVILLFVLLRVIRPTSDALRRHWYLMSAQAEMRGLLTDGYSRRPNEEALFRDADRIRQLAALQPSPDGHRDDLRQAMDLFGRAAAVRRVRTTLTELVARTGSRLMVETNAALAACDPLRLRRIADDLAGATAGFSRDDLALARAARLDLIWAASLIDPTAALGVHPHGSFAS